MPVVKLSNTTLYYESDADEIVDNTQSIIFIHGLGSSTRDWRHQVNYFRQSFTIFTVGLHGFGQSDHSKRPLSMHDYAQDIIELINFLGLSKPHIVGLSLGAMVCYEIATSTPQIILSTTIINALPEFVPRTFKEGLSVLLRFTMLHLLGMNLPDKVLAKKLFIKQNQQALRRSFLVHWKHNKKHNYLAAMKAILNWSVVDKLDNIVAPVLIIAAEHDYSSIQKKREFAKLISLVSIEVIKNSWHATPVDQADSLNKTLKKFYSTINSLV